MANNKISGSYILQSFNIDEYTLTGNNRDALVSVSESRVNLIDLSNGSQLDRVIDLLTKNKIHVKGIRVITPGAEGLRACKNCARFWFQYYSIIDSENKGLLSIVEVERYNEWQVLDDYWEPYKLAGKENFFNLGISHAEFNIDDYNIQSAYVGKKVKFAIELKIDTAGIFLDNKII